jgi:fermentation-respiration switch protein FrsA (DUF1100 family)
MLWCHGNAGNIIHRLDNLTELHDLGLSVFLFDYRGYGRSAGRPTEAGLYQDGMAAYHYLVSVRKVPPRQLVVFGRSLGAAVAGDVASREAAAGLILESAFPSVQALAKQYLWGLPAHWLLAARFDLAARLQNVRMPVLVIHGDRDDIVPFAMGEQVFQSAPSPKSFYRVNGADHNQLYVIGGKSYFHRLKQFVDSVVG